MECKACGTWYVSGDKSGICPTCTRTLKKMGLDLPYDRICELVEADKNKQVIIKPKGFYVGEEIFVIESEFWTGNPAGVYRNRIKGFAENGVFYRHSPTTPVYFESFEYVGKTMFLDEKEAKKVLSETKGENK